MTITDERLAEIKAFKNTDFSDCPVLTDEQLAQFKPSHLRGLYKPVKKTVNVRIDADIIEWLKSNGAGYQTRLTQYCGMLCSRHLKCRLVQIKARANNRTNGAKAAAHPARSSCPSGGA
ncbi:hypothetical protein FACS1894200_11770 [Spirochaetia bacterium]|nr:hypothetical protein FACS1894200_11770 [Spirochaetia bacterium]